MSVVQPQPATNPNSAVVYALTADRSLWECTLQNDQVVSWVQVSPAAFVSISASSNAEGQPVVYGIVSAPGTVYDHTLWENNPEFNPGAADPNGQWQEVSPAAFDSISATQTTLNGPLQPVVYGIVSSDHSLWENNPTFNPSAATLNEQWLEVSPGAFVAVSATIHQEPNYQSNTPMPVLPVAFAVVAGDRSLWEQDPSFNPTSSDLNTQWRKVSADAWASIGATTYHVGNDAVYTFGNYPLAWGVKAADGSLWEANANYPGNPYTQQVSSDAWASVSQNVVIRASDLSLWRANSANMNANGVYEISDGTFESIAAAGDGELVAGVLTDHSLWLNDENSPNRTDLSGDWTELSPSGTIA